MKNIKMRYPIYLKEFKCIGGCDCCYKKVIIFIKS
ncbi:hypothetical protein Cp4433_02412 [Clostridium perfringens]|nr:hypothetical protein [Clostridium perfringens]MDG6887784.1 hypothetical protein [Clostridium perfringens]MDH5079191.1 hypothetical protein [Clostridium perfringens]